MKVDVLGTEYEVFVSDLNNPEFMDCDGKCYSYEKRIGLRGLEYLLGPDYEDKYRERRLDEVIRHELVHAFSMESGTSYTDDEVLVDWIARMIPKINQAFFDIKRQLVKSEV